MVRSVVRAIVSEVVRRRCRGAISLVKERMGEMRSRLSRPRLYRWSSRERVGIVFSVQSHLSTPERLLLYTLVRGLRPKRILEIGTARGGSAAIMATAMEDNGGEGLLVTIDPKPKVDRARTQFHGRVKLVEQPAPQGIFEARRVAGQAFDLVFYDGPNVYDEVVRSIDAFLPHLSPTAYVVFDNGFHFAIDAALREFAGRTGLVHDCGCLVASPNAYDAKVAYNGLRLVRISADRFYDLLPAIDAAYREVGKPAPRSTPSSIQHDLWYCRAVQPCRDCAAAGTDRDGAVK